MKVFVLDQRIEAEALAIGALALSEALLLNDARFPWIILVPRRAGRTEIFDLNAADRAQLGEETAAVAFALKQATGCTKINIGALGNIVRQLHVHVVARREGDAAWPGPVWGFGARTPYVDDEGSAFAARLRAAIGAS